MTVSNETYLSDTTGAGRVKEGKLTRKIEDQTARIPSLFFLGVAGATVAVSLGIKLAGYDKTANFVGQWVPTILLLGIYNKIVKEV